MRAIWFLPAALSLVGAVLALGLTLQLFMSMTAADMQYVNMPMLIIAFAVQLLKTLAYLFTGLWLKGCLRAEKG